MVPKNSKSTTQKNNLLKKKYIKFVTVWLKKYLLNRHDIDDAQNADFKKETREMIKCPRKKIV